MLRMNGEIVLEKLEKLLDSWDIKSQDWILVANYAYKLLGYKVKLRLGHLNILVKKNSIPWNVSEGIEVHPPRNSRFRIDFQEFIKETKFDFDINLATDKEFREKRGKFVYYTLSNEKMIQVQTPEGAIKEYEKLLSLSTKEALGVERLVKDIDYIKDMIKALKENKEFDTVRKFTRLLKKYLSVKKKKYKEKKTGKSEIIRGISASKGKVRGKVVVIDDLQYTGKILKESVLVTKMTSPTLTIMLPKIRAIVTDWGGKLSHAAILAREMKIPCVVGAQVATKLLRDDDLVEVDAVKGIVKILK